MLILTVLTSMAVGGIALLLYLRLTRAQREVRLALCGKDDDGFLRGLSRSTAIAVDSLFPADIVERGITASALRFREHNDPYQTIKELLDFIRKNGASRDRGTVELLVKGVYQLAYTLNRVPDSLTPVLGVLEARILKAEPSWALSRVTPGVLLDRGKMLPITFGTHVIYPFGVIITDQNGAVISRAKVRCQ